MPTSIDPQPADDEIECGRCGAHVYYELTRCPNCGVNLYEPDEALDPPEPQLAFRKADSRKGLLAWVEDLFRRITGRPYPVDELFGAALNQAELYNDLLLKVGGDRPTVERLIEFERRQLPEGNRIRWLENAIRHWEQDNRSSSGE